MRIFAMAALAFGLCWLVMLALYLIVDKHSDARWAAALGVLSGSLYYVGYLFLCDLIFGTGFSSCLFFGVSK